MSNASGRISDGVIGGLIAGVVMGVMMQMLSVPTPGGDRVPMMMMVSQVVGSSSLLVGWIYHLFNSAVIGGLFGLLMSATAKYGKGIGYGALYGFSWWVVGGLLLMPLFLGMPAFGPLLMESMWPVAIGSLVGHLAYGVTLGASYVALERSRGVPVRPIEPDRAHRQTYQYR